MTTLSDILRRLSVQSGSRDSATRSDVLDVNCLFGEATESNQPCTLVEMDPAIKRIDLECSDRVSTPTRRRLEVLPVVPEEKETTCAGDGCKREDSVESLELAVYV